MPARQILANRQIMLGGALVFVALTIALTGPLIAPHDPKALVGTPYSGVSIDAPLGEDSLGRDVWSRVLSGGLSLIWMSISATAIAALVGGAIGLVAGFAGRALDQFIVWCTDVVLAFPDLILVLLVVSMIGRAPWLIVLTVSVALIPGMIRLTRGLTLGVSGQDYIQAARIMGYPWPRILFREILPNIRTPLLIQSGVMLTWAIGIIAGLSFLGYGIAPPAADWGLMINENRGGLMVQPWAVVAPTILISILALGTNLIAEGIGRMDHLG